MALRLGVVGRGYWGNTYTKVLDQLGIAYWQAGRDWKQQQRPDGLIVASSTPSHFAIAKDALEQCIPVLVEKPVCLTTAEARTLISLGGVVFAGHTRLYDPAWREFKKQLHVVHSVEAWAGGVNPTNPDALLNWWAHLVPMCADLGFDPDRAVFHIQEEKRPVRFVVNGTHEYTDGLPGALANLVREFCAAIESGAPDNSGLRLGVRAVQFMEKNQWRNSIATPS